MVAQTSLVQQRRGPSWAWDVQSALADPTSLTTGVIVTVFEMKMREDYVRRIRDRQLFCMMIWFIQSNIRAVKNSNQAILCYRTLRQHPNYWLFSPTKYPGPAGRALARQTPDRWRTSTLRCPGLSPKESESDLWVLVSDMKYFLSTLIFMSFPRIEI